jgi:hypothetical protein
MMIKGSEDASVGPLREALAVCAMSGTSGILRITGDPGGTIHLARGLVTAVETAGAPGPEVLLLRSRRVAESAWDAAFSAAAAAGRPVSAELIARKLVGTGELEALLLTALADAMFALASGTVDEYRAEPGSSDRGLALEPGAEADWLLAEAARRIKVLASLPSPPVYRRERLVAAVGAVRPDVRLGQGYDEILALADGRRTPRDLAFALGRGIYATTMQLARLHQDGLLVPASARVLSRPARQAGPDAAVAGPEPGGLPRRAKGLLDVARRAAPPHRAYDGRAPLGLLRPRSSRDAGPGQMP